MNIVFLNPIGQIGGGERILIEVVTAIITEIDRAQVTVLLLENGPLKQQLTELGAEVIVVPLPQAVASFGDSRLIGGPSLRQKVWLAKQFCTSSFAMVTFIFRLRSIIRKLKPDLLHSNGLKTHLLTALVRTRASKVVWHLHDFYSARPAVSKALTIAAKRADHGIAISKAIEKDTHCLAKRLPISVIYNAVDTSHFSPDDYNSNTLDQLAGLSAAPNETVRLGLVATYANWKGHHAFIEAFAQTAFKATVPIRGYIIGGPIYSTAGSQVTEEELRSQISELGMESKIGLIPFQRDTASIYRMLDIVVHASTRPEPFGLTIVEAMSCGKAVIVSAAGGSVELFEDGVSGIGHDLGNVEILAAAMLRIANSETLRKDLGVQGRVRAVECFSLERFRSEVVQFVEHALL